MSGLMLVQLSSMRDALAEALLELGGKDSRIVVLGADTSVSIKTSVFADRYPDRFFNIGIAEANMIGIAAGLALAGKIPYVSTYSAFVPGKCLDQIRNAIAYPNLDVKIVSSHGGVTVGPDGASHQTIEDVAVMRAIPHMRVVIPADAPATRALIEESWKTSGPFYVRLSRPSVPEVYSSRPDLKVGHVKILKEGTDLAIIACGVMVNEALEAGDSLAKEGISTEIVDSHTLKPLDAGAIVNVARKTGGIVTAEEQNVIGGLGSAVAEVVSGSYPVPISMVGVRDTFGESGEHKELMAKYGLTSKEIVSAAKKLVASR
jgi:transketolase